MLGNDQPGKLACMPIFKGNDDSVEGEACRTVQRIRRETRLGLFTIRDDRRARVFEPADRIAKCILGDLLETGIAKTC
jgi:hypothetical protein